MRQARLGLLLLMMLDSCLSFGQSAQVTNAAIYRTFMIQTSVERGTIFSIDVDGREYWITAKHLFTGVKTGPAGEFVPSTAVANVLSQPVNVEQNQGQQWRTITFRVIDPGKDIDILVLVPNISLLSPIVSLNSDPGGIGLGADCEFLGFPWGGGWKAKFGTGQSVWFPYIKHCMVSASLNDGLNIWVLDGINNEGFSGGPVLYGTGSNQKVFAVISGYYIEPLEVLTAQSPDGRTSNLVPRPPKLPGAKDNPSGKQVVNSNSGFIVAFDIQSAIKAIHNNPIGPLRPTN